jgi:AP-1-like factor
MCMPRNSLPHSHGPVCGFCQFQQNAEEDNVVASASPNVQEFPQTSSSRRNEPTILDKLPLYEPAVPIKRRNKGVHQTPSFLSTKRHLPKVAPQATCSGDPNNCLACAGDSFGQAFCAAIGSSSSKCDCSAEMMSGCCGSSSRCSDCPFYYTFPEAWYTS